MKKRCKSVLLVFIMLVVSLSLIVACSPAERPEAPATEPGYPDRPLNQPEVPIVEQQRQQQQEQQQQRFNEIQEPAIEIDEDRLGDQRHMLEQRAPQPGIQQ